MSRKHFEQIAAKLATTKPSILSHGALYDGAQMQWTNDVASVADVLAASNTRFDRARFLKACDAKEGR